MAPRSGVTIHGFEFDWIEAAHSDHMSYLEFREKPVEYQNKIIAYHQTQQQIEAVKAHANRPRKRPRRR